MMDNNKKMEERLKHNEPFLRAFDYYATKLKFNQKTLAEKIGSSSSAISIYRKGMKKVSIDTMQKLVDFSEGKLNMDYLLRLSDYMLAENVPANERSDIKERKENPDYDLMRTRIEKEERALNESIADKTSVSLSSLFNAVLAAKDETIASLERELNSKDELIISLRSHVTTLQRQVDEYRVIKNKSFATGVAEPNYSE